MKSRFKKYVSVFLVVSMVVTLMSSMIVSADENENNTPIELTQVGSVLDFEDGELVGTVTGAPAVEGPGSVTVANFDSKVLRVQPPSSSGASYWWTLPLDSGEYDLTDNDLVEVSFDWWVDITRPNANSLDVRLNNGDNRVITLRSNGGGTAVNSPANVTYYAGNALNTNAPEVGSAITALSSVPRLTKLTATINVDLRSQVASITVTDGDARNYTTPEPITIAESQLTSLSVGASRANGQNWARFNNAGDIVWDEDSYGMRLDNIVIKAAASGLEAPDIYPSEVTITPAEANLEYGEGSLADKHSATFSAIVLPINATDRSYTWSISDENIASIAVNENDSVTVTAVGEGTATLTATSNMDEEVKASVPINVSYIPPIAEPTPNFDDLVEDGYTLAFGSNFAGDDDVPLWIFAGGTYHALAREDDPQVNNYFRFDASGSGNRGGKGDLPQAVFGSKVYAHFDWKVPAVTTNQNTFNLSFQDGSNTLLSLRTGTYGTDRTIGAFAGALPGPTGPDPNNFWSSDRYHAFSYNAVNTWYTVDVEFDFDEMIATVSLVPRDQAAAEPSVLTIPFDGSQISSFVLTGERAGGNNINIEDNGIDNMYFFTKPLSSDTITEVLPYEFLPALPETADSNSLQSWTKVVYIGDVADEEELELPETINVKVAGGTTESVAVNWELTEIPWTLDETELVYDPNKQGVFGYVGTLVSEPEVAVNRMAIKAKLYIENRNKNKMNDEPYSMEWLDRGVVAVPVNDGEGNLVTWRLLATEYNQGLTFNVYRNGTKINSTPIATLNFIDEEGTDGDVYVVETISTGKKSKAVEAWANNYIDIPLQKPADRVNPARAYGASEADAADITYTANDMSVADVNGDGQYEVLVKWYPSQAQDPGLTARHTGETIFDLYTLEGELLWRINLGINITSSAHHSPFNFYDLDQDGRAELAIKTADGTRGYLPKEDGTINDLVDEPAWVLGDPEAVWVGQVENPARDNAINGWATGRVADGPETWTVFNGLTGEPIETVDYFAPYSINANWGDPNNNRSDRFNGAVGYLPKNGVAGAEPYPTVIEVRGHYGPHFAAAYQFIDGEIVELWTFKLADWNAGSNQGNHNLALADLDNDGYSEIVLGSLTLDQDGSILWSLTGAKGTVSAVHGDALHVAAMVPDSDEIYVFSPHEAGPPNNVTLVKGSSGEPVWTYSANKGDVGRGVAANITPLPGYEVWAVETPMYNIVSGEVLTADVGDIGVANKAPVNFILYWDGDLLSELFDGPDNFNSTDAPSITKFNYDVETGDSELVTLQQLTGAYSNNGTKANPGLIADIFGDWREEVLVRTSDNQSLRIYTTDIPTDNVIYTLMHDPVYRLSVNSQNSMYNQPTHIGFYLGEDIADQVQAKQLPTPNLFYTVPQSMLSRSTATFYRNDRSDIQVTVTLNGNTLTAIKNGDEALTEADYSLSEVTDDGKQVVTLKKSYLAQLSNGDVLTFVFSDGEPSVLKITVTTRDTSTPIEPPGETPAPSPTPAPTTTPEPEKPSLKGEIANAEQLKANVKQALEANSPADFPDVNDGHWATQAIKYASQLGIVEGYSNGEFNGSGNVTRAEFAAMIARALGIEAGEGGTFTDTTGHWANGVIGALQRAGIVQGSGNGNFNPDQQITRAEMVTILARVLDLSAANGTAKFTDLNGHWAAEHIEKLSEVGIVNGVGADRFAPNDTATREQSVTIIVRMLNLVLDLGLEL